MKKIVLLLTAFFCFFGSMATGAMAEEAHGQNSILLLDSQAVEIYPYNIAGNNYFKIRDMAKILAETDSKFDISWNAEAEIIEIISGREYHSEEEIRFPMGEQIAEALPVESRLVADGNCLSLPAYNINGSNYFKIRDLANLTGGNVNWNEELQLMEWLSKPEISEQQMPELDSSFSQQDHYAIISPVDEPKIERIEEEIPKAEVLTEQRPSVVVTDAEVLLNGAELHSKLTAFQAINHAVVGFMDEQFTPGMDTYTKAKTAYDYFIRNMSYGTAKNLNMTLFSASEAGIIWQCYPERYILPIMENHVGVCNHYSCAYAAILRAIGLDVEVVSGKTYAAGGGFSNHVWVEAVIDGNRYVFDPQVEQNITKRNGGVIKYNRFAKPVSQVANLYQDGIHYSFTE